MKYTYLVSYSYTMPDGKSGFGLIDIINDQKIDSGNRALEVVEIIKKKNEMKDVVPLCFNLVKWSLF